MSIDSLINFPAVSEGARQEPIDKERTEGRFSSLSRQSSISPNNSLPSTQTSNRTTQEFPKFEALKSRSESHDLPLWNESIVLSCSKQ